MSSGTEKDPQVNAVPGGLSRQARIREVSLLPCRFIREDGVAEQELHRPRSSCLVLRVTSRGDWRVDVHA